MANIETGFIPEQGVTYQGGAPRSTIATVFSVIVTVLALIGTVGAWWLDRKEEVTNQKLKAELAGMEEKINFGKISQLSQLDKRINVARGMLNNHAMPSVLLKFLADNTVASVKWKQFKYSRMATAPKTAGAADVAIVPGDILELSGETSIGSGYGPLYQQVNRFRAQTDAVQSVELQSFQIDPRTGVVSLQVKLVIKPTYATFGGLRSRAAPLAQSETQGVVNGVPPSVTPPAVEQGTPPAPNATGTVKAPAVVSASTTVVKPPITQ